MGYKQISYITPLYQVAQNLTPKRILELGCGCSTYILRWLWKDAEMVVIDDHASWMAGNDCMGGHYKIDKRILINRDNDCLKKSTFERHILHNGQFDFIFVDCGHLYNDSGHWRNDFINLILKNDLLNKNGVMMLHDANREEHRKIVEMDGQLMPSFNTWVYHNTEVKSDDQ